MILRDQPSPWSCAGVLDGSTVTGSAQAENKDG